MFEKQIRKVNVDYTEWLRRQPCCLLAFGGCTGEIYSIDSLTGSRSEGHHTTTRGAGGSDEEQVPMCAGHHSMGHHYGWPTMENLFEVDFKAFAKEYFRRYNAALVTEKLRRENRFALPQN